MSEQPETNRNGYNVTIQYALFAGAFSVGYAWVWDFLFLHNSSPPALAIEFSISELLYVSLAMLSAFVGSILAVWTRRSPCGWEAAGYTSLAYPLLLLLSGLLIYGSLAKGSWILLFYVWIVVLLPCIVGTLLFNLLLNLTGRANPLR